MGSGAFDKPYFVGFMLALAFSGLAILLFFGWWWFNRGLSLWEKLAGFSLLVLELVLAGRFAHRSVTMFTLWMIGVPVVASLIVGKEFAGLSYRLR